MGRGVTFWHGRSKSDIGGAWGGRGGVAPLGYHSRKWLFWCISKQNTAKSKVFPSKSAIFGKNRKSANPPPAKNWKKFSGWPQSMLFFSTGAWSKKTTYFGVTPNFFSIFRGGGNSSFTVTVPQNTRKQLLVHSDIYNCMGPVQKQGGTDFSY